MKQFNKRKLSVIVALLMCMILAFGSTFAYLTDTDNEINTVTIGKVGIDVVEDLWSQLPDTNGDGIPDAAEAVIPNQSVTKDPSIKNTGNNDAYVYLSVEVPNRYITSYNPDGTKVNAGLPANTDLFYYNINAGWELITSKSYTDKTVFTYAYSEKLGAGAETPTLFDAVTVVNTDEKQGLEETIQNIVINGYAIQSDNVNGIINGWNIINNQTGLNTVAATNMLMAGPDFNATIPDTATKVAFVDDIAPTTYSTRGTSVLDVSAAQDGGVVAWYDEATTTYYVSTQKDRINVVANPDASYMFSNKTSLKEFDFDNFSTRATTSMKGMFYNCSGLTDIDVSSFDTSNVTNMSYLFAAPVTNTFKNYSDLPMNLKTIKFGDNFVTSKVTDISYILYYNTSLTELDIDDWDVSNVTSMHSAFFNCCNLTTFGENALANWDTGEVVNMEHAFRWLKKLTALNLENWDVSNVKTFSYCFCNGAWTDVLDLEAWDISNCEDLSFMFHSFKTLTTLKVNTWDVRNVVTFDHFIAQMGSNFKNMDVSGWQVTNKCKNLNAVFHGFKGTTLDVSGWDTSNVEIFCQMFDGCTNLTEIIGLQDLDTSNGKDFTEMFQTNKIKHLDLTFLDTRKATPDLPLGKNGTNGTGMQGMMYGSWNSLEKITVSDKLSHDGDGSCIDNVEIHHYGYPDEVETVNCGFIFPKSKTGYWYNIETGKQYLNTEIPDDTAATYVRDASMLPEGVTPN